jgi:hypothetical protein
VEPKATPPLDATKKKELRMILKHRIDDIGVAYTGMNAAAAERTMMLAIEEAYACGWVAGRESVRREVLDG